MKNSFYRLLILSILFMIIFSACTFTPSQIASPSQSENPGSSDPGYSPAPPSVSPSETPSPVQSPIFTPPDISPSPRDEQLRLVKALLESCPSGAMVVLNNMPDTVFTLDDSIRVNGETSTGEPFVIISALPDTRVVIEAVTYNEASSDFEGTVFYEIRLNAGEYFVFDTLRPEGIPNYRIVFSNGGTVCDYLVQYNGKTGTDAVEYMLPGVKLGRYTRTIDSAENNLYPSVTFNADHTFQIQESIGVGMGTYTGTFSASNGNVSLSVRHIDFSGFDGDDVTAINFAYSPSDDTIKLLGPDLCTTSTGDVFALETGE